MKPILEETMVVAYVSYIFLLIEIRHCLFLTIEFSPKTIYFSTTASPPRTI